MDLGKLTAQFFGSLKLICFESRGLLLFYGVEALGYQPSVGKPGSNEFAFVFLKIFI